MGRDRTYPLFVIDNISQKMSILCELEAMCEVEQ